MIPPPPRPTLFPYTTLFRSLASVSTDRGCWPYSACSLSKKGHLPLARLQRLRIRVRVAVSRGTLGAHTLDRKSTRLNSSHRCISYAVFCLKKKKKTVLQ